MPTKRQRVRRAPAGRLDPHVAVNLLTGVTPAFLSTTPARLRAAWGEHGERLLAQWVAEHPGTRPWAWWRFDCTEPRRQIGGKGVLLTDQFPNVRAPLDRGVPAFAAVDAADPPAFEPEAAYLERLGLLVDGERERIRPSAFEPVIVRTE